VWVWVWEGGRVDSAAAARTLPHCEDGEVDKVGGQGVLAQGGHTGGVAEVVSHPSIAGCNVTRAFLGTLLDHKRHHTSSTDRSGVLS
jgi:hypothetical protein